MYNATLTATLQEGLTGAEENILYIILYKVIQYVDGFSNDWAGLNSLKKDHKCTKLKKCGYKCAKLKKRGYKWANLKSSGYNCAIFDWVARNAVFLKQC